MSLVDLTFLLRRRDNTESLITRLRNRVFMDEYKLPSDFLRHKEGAERYHVVGYDEPSATPVTTGCIYEDGHIGRIFLPWVIRLNIVACP